MKRAVKSVATALSLALGLFAAPDTYSSAAHSSPANPQLQTQAQSTNAQNLVLATASSTTGVSVEEIASDTAAGITEYKLKPNNLQVLLCERHHTPIVTVMVVYHVGSRNEAVGYTGSTHFLEHMMFRGTTDHDPRKGSGIDDVLKPIGGLNNATTSYDRTNYYELVPAQYLGTCLELEADRMRNALLRKEDHDAEMTVVRNELERNEDDPGRLLDWNLFAHSYLAHPYHHPVIGWRSDVENVPVARLRQFYDEFYYPNNATLVVIGDFKTPEALSMIQKYFGAVPASPNPFPKVYTTEPPQEGQRRFTVQRGSDLPKVTLGFHAPAATSKDTYALEVASSILGDDKKQSSRLYKALIDTNLASDCYAYNTGLKDPSVFSVFATATPGTKSEKLEEILYDQLQKLATDPPSAQELDKAKKSVWKRMKLEAADPMGTASQLAEAIAVADWHWWVDLEKNLQAVTADDVKRVAQKYFNKRNETVGYYYPSEKPSGTGPSAPSEPPGPAGLHDGDTPESISGQQRAIAEATEVATADVGAAGKTTIASQVQKRVLPNGLTLLVMPVKGTGVVSIAGKMRAGDYFHPPQERSIPDLTADMLDKGSVHWSKEALARQLELMGSSLDFSAGNFWMDFESDVVKEDVPTYMDMIADVLQHPLFPTEELAKEKKQREAEIHAAMADNDQVASNAFYGAVYKPNCVYYQEPFKQQLNDLSKITVDQLKAFHKAHISPANTVLAIVGDIDPNQAFSLAEKAFGSWTGAPAGNIDVTMCAAEPIKAHTITNQMADKANVEVVMGTPANVSIKSKDFYAAQVANAALGHDTLSSRLAEMRNKLGYTYGVSSYFAETAFENAPWMIDFTVNPENLHKAIPVAQRILADYVKTGITKQEVTDEGKRLAGEYIIERMRTPHQLADAITKYEILGIGAKFMDEYPALLSKVTQEEANAAIKKYFDASKLVTSVAGTVPAAQK